MSWATPAGRSRPCSYKQTENGPLYKKYRGPFSYREEEGGQLRRDRGSCHKGALQRASPGEEKKKPRRVLALWDATCRKRREPVGWATGEKCERGAESPPFACSRKLFRCNRKSSSGCQKSQTGFLDSLGSAPRALLFCARKGRTAHAVRPCRYRGKRGICPQQSSYPAGMASSSISRWSFSPPSSSLTAEMSMPLDSRPIIFRGLRLTQATTVLPTRVSGS